MSNNVESLLLRLVECRRRGLQRAMTGCGIQLLDGDKGRIELLAVGEELLDLIFLPQTVEARHRVVGRNRIRKFAVLGDYMPVRQKHRILPGVIEKVLAVDKKCRADFPA